MPNNHTISQRKYDDAHCRYITLKLNLTTDKSVLAKLDSVPSRQGYIKELVLRDLGIEPKRKKGDLTMENTLYTALIEAEDGIHLFHQNVSDEHGAYENFEYAMQDKANEIDGELHCIYSKDDIVEDVTLPDDPGTPLDE